MCGACRKRSNWKWDIMKHIREKHTDGAAEIPVIELSTEEAKASLNDYLRQRNQRPVTQLGNPAATGNDAATAAGFSETSKNFYCDQCPYSTSSGKDSIYHKQFHHPNAANPLKCPHCNFWVGHRSKLTLHVKVHESTGIFGPYSSEGMISFNGKEEERGLPPGISKEQAVFASLLDLSPAPRASATANAGAELHRDPSTDETMQAVDRKEIDDAASTQPPGTAMRPVAPTQATSTQPHLPPSKIHRQQIADSNLR